MPLVDCNLTQQPDGSYTARPRNCRYWNLEGVGGTMESALADLRAKCEQRDVEDAEDVTVTIRRGTLRDWLYGDDVGAVQAAVEAVMGVQRFPDKE